MNTSNPLVPQGSLTKETKGKRNIRIAVFTILAVHVVLLGGLLAQGCKPEQKKEVKENLTPTNSLPPLAAESPYYSSTSPPPEITAHNVPPITPALPPEPVVAPAPAPVMNTTEYTVSRGDSYSKIAKAKGVSIAMIRQANPGVDPLKLKLGQKLQIPVPANTPAASGLASEMGGNETKPSTYVVKAGDSLARIAKQHGTTINAIKTANNLKTTQIKVGQKLKLPPGKTSVAKSGLFSPGSIPTVASSNLPLTAPSNGSIPHQ
jgi:LysM repeat protein